MNSCLQEVAYDQSKWLLEGGYWGSIKILWPDESASSAQIV